MYIDKNLSFKTYSSLFFILFASKVPNLPQGPHKHVTFGQIYQKGKIGANFVSWMTNGAGSRTALKIRS